MFNSKATIVDNIYFNDTILSLTNVYIPSAYSPATGYDVNAVSGTVVCTDVDVAKLNGAYIGKHTTFSLLRNPGSVSHLSFKLDVPSGGVYHLDVRYRHNILATSVANNRVTFTQGKQGQILNIYSKDDSNKFFLDDFDFPKLPFKIYLGKGDFDKLTYDDLDGSGLSWHLLEVKTDRVGVIPTTGYWERGRKFYYHLPTPGGKVGAVCTANGSPGTWKEFGGIDI